MLDPQSMTPGSIMPAYGAMFEDDLDTTGTISKIYAMRKMGVPYPDGYEGKANADLRSQAIRIKNKLNDESKIKVSDKKEIIALIAYLQRLGTDIKADSPKK